MQSSSAFDSDVKWWCGELRCYPTAYPKECLVECTTPRPKMGGYKNKAFQSDFSGG